MKDRKVYKFVNSLRMVPVFYAFLIIFGIGRAIFELGEYRLKINICRKLC